MTMVRLLRSSANCRTHVAGIVWLAGWLTTTAAAVGQQPPVHYLHAGAMPPGAIGSQQLLRGGPLPGYFQPVEVRAPAGAQIALAADGAFQPGSAGPVTAGMLIGAVYRLRVTDIPQQPGLEVFPTIEVVDRLYPPVGEEGRFPIPIELTAEELEFAIAGKFVTRVIYLEDPDAALPEAEDPRRQSYFEAAIHDNPLEVADRMGRPMAILRMGGRLPDTDGPDAAFLYGSPPWVRFVQPQVERARVLPPERPAPAVEDEAGNLNSSGEAADSGRSLQAVAISAAIDTSANASSAGPTNVKRLRIRQPASNSRSTDPSIQVGR